MYAITAQNISMGEIETLLDRENKNFIFESLDWSWQVTKDVFENLLFSLPGLYGESPTVGNKLIVSKYGNIRDIPVLLTTEGMIKNQINNFSSSILPYIESVVDVGRFIKFHDDIQSDTITKMQNDSLINTYIQLYDKLGDLYEAGLEYI